MANVVDNEEHERRRAVVARGMAVGASWREMAAEAGVSKETMRYYANRHFGDLLPERPVGYYDKPDRGPSVRERKPPKVTMHRNCLRCETVFLSERADGAWLRMCPECRSVSHVGHGMEGGAGRQVRGARP